MPRFVILLHEMPEGSARPTHWDLMLECGEVLRTWALPAPLSPGGELIAQELPDHRLDYLDYEGEVSGNRGRVTRWDAGDYQLVQEGPAPQGDSASPGTIELEIAAHGAKLSGNVVLRRLEALDHRGADAPRSPEEPRYWSVTWKGS